MVQLLILATSAKLVGYPPPNAGRMCPPDWRPKTRPFVTIPRASLVILCGITALVLAGCEREKDEIRTITVPKAARAPDEPAVRQLLERLKVPYKSTTAIFRAGRFARGSQSTHELGPSHKH